MPNILIVKINKTSNTESFIANHVGRLPDVKKVIYGSSLRYYESGTDKPLLREDKLVYKLLLWIKRKVLKKTYNSQLISAQRNYISKHKITHVLAEYGISGVNILKACKQLNIPLVVHFHGYDANNFNITTKYRNQYTELFDYAKATVAVSSSMKERLIKLGANKENTYHITYGVDVSIFKPNNRKDKEPTFIMVGRLIAMKAPYLTLLAFREVLRKIPDAKLVIIGDTGIEGQSNPIRQVMIDMIVALKLGSKVKLLGNISHDEISSQLSHANIFVLHSVTDTEGNAEGTPNVILEAMASGLPIVSTIHEGIVDVVTHGVNGYLVDERDIDKMAYYMCLLGENGALAKDFGEKGRNYVLNKANIEQSIMKLYQIIIS